MLSFSKVSALHTVVPTGVKQLEQMKGQLCDLGQALEMSLGGLGFFFFLSLPNEVRMAS